MGSSEMVMRECKPYFNLAGVAMFTEKNSNLHVSEGTVSLELN